MLDSTSQPYPHNLVPGPALPHVFRVSKQPPQFTQTPRPETLLPPPPLPNAFQPQPWNVLFKEKVVGP